MSDPIPSGQEHSAADHVAPEERDDDREYAVAVAAKQAGVSREKAAEGVARLTAEERAALVAAGRGGRIAECRRLLGLD